MVTKVRKWGNSQGLRPARQVLEDAHIAVGDVVEVPPGEFAVSRLWKNWFHAYPETTSPEKLVGGAQ